jgi:ABC-type lipoprotein release transport system permease subunit
MFPLVLRSLRFYWRAHLGVLTGALLASAVLTGALLVGDSVDYSLRTFALMRLGDIDFAADTKTQYFRENLSTAIEDQAGFPTASILLLRGMAISQGETAADRLQINQVQVHGVDDDFWRFADGVSINLGANETVLSSKLAAALGVGEGDEISLRVAKPSLMARDAPLSWRGEERSRRANYTVMRVLSDDELGRFSLSASQIAPYNAFVDRLRLQGQVELEGRANLLVAGGGVKADVLDSALSDVWDVEHIGLDLRTFADGSSQLETDRVYLDAETSRAALSLPGAQGTLAYLLNSISKGAASTPYSFAVAGPTPDGMGDDEIVINRWLADALDGEVGDRITLAYSELLPTGKFLDQQREFTVHSIREMDSLKSELDRMPNFPGLSDVESCSDWDVGMPMDDDLLADPANEEYWEAYNQTPKVLVTLAAGQAMWSNRFGNLSGVRYGGGDVAAIRDGLKREMDPTKAGLFFIPARDQAMNAVSQAMDFGGLFLGMSFFLIVAALMLTGLLFVFGVQQRSAQMGALLALGFRPGTVRVLLLGEGLIIALVGTVAGAALGTLYTRALIYGLSQYWQGAVANAAIFYHAKSGTLAMGAVISLVCAMVAMALAMWRQSKHPARELLAMDFTQDHAARRDGRSGKLGLALSILALAGAVAIIAYAQISEVAEVAMPFFGAGALLLMAGLGFCRHILILLNSGGDSDRLSLSRLALQNVARRRGRSLAVVGLLACGCFLVFAVSAMQEDLGAHAHHRSSGTGGFSLVAESTIPLLEDPMSAIDIPGVSATAIKVRDGDDASCLNLNHAQTPRVMGVTVADLASRGAFSKEGDEGAIWDLLNMELEDGAIPALVGDANTVMWSLKKKAHVDKGDVLIYHDEAGNEAPVKLVGALPMRLSVFQGTILISDAAFTRMYPSEEGHRMFLVDTPAGQESAVTAELRQKFDRFGLDAIPAVKRVLEYYAVETTYLAMFLVLGGLGLAIGSAGMGVVVLRNLLERRRELAMLHALGYDRSPVYRILFTEYGFLLAAGLAIGGFAAGVSMLPALLAANSGVNLVTELQIALLVLVASSSCMGLAITMGFHKGGADALRIE